MADVVDKVVDASADDGHEVEGTGVMSIAGTTVYHKSIADINYRRWGACRWHGFNIPLGSTITACYISYYPYSLEYDDAYFDMHFEKAAAPISLTIANGNITSRARSTASVLWSANGLGVNWVNSPSLVAPLQEVVDAFTVTAIVVIDKPYSDATKMLLARSWDFSDHSLAPKLHIEYTPPAAPPVGSSPGAIIRSFTAPGTDGQGLTWDGRTLWHSDKGANLIYQIDPATGTVIRSFASPDADSSGLAFDGRALWNTDFNADLIYQIDPATGRVIRSFASPSSEPAGLTFDGRTLWCVDRFKDRIYQIDPATGTVIRSFASPAASPRGLTWDGRWLWHCDTITLLIYQINPETGRVIRTFACPGTDPRGLTWDGRTLWHCDTNTELIYQIVV